MRLRSTIATDIAMARNAAGTKPARNNEPTDRLVIDPRISSANEGGLTSPIAAAAASTATDSVGG